MCQSERSEESHILRFSSLVFGCHLRIFRLGLCNGKRDDLHAQMTVAAGGLCTRRHGVAAAGWKERQMAIPGREFMLRKLCFMLVLSVWTGAACAEVRLAKIFTSDMLLQRDQPIRVWGWAAPQEAVTVILDGQKAATTADAQGKWLAELPARKQGENLTLTNTGMAVILDTVPLKSAGDIHPRNKSDVGQRLARWALNRDYGQKELVVSSGAVPEPVAVRYAFSMNPDGANLYNREGLPASPFRTDNW